MGQIGVETNETVLDFAWAYYSGEGIFTPPEGLTTQIFSRAGAGLPLLTSGPDPGVFPLSLPLGYGTASASFPPLPAGSYTLKVWVGQKGVFQQSGITPPTGVLAVAQAAVTVSQPAILVWVDNPRQLSEGSQTLAMIGAATAVSYDRLFVLQGNGVAHPAVEQVIIPAYQAWSSSFAVSLDDMVSEGVVTATDENGEIWRSSQLTTVKATMTIEVGGPPGPEGVWEGHAYCSRKAGPVPGPNWKGRSCGPCTFAYVPPRDPSCVAVGQGKDAMYVPHQCSWHIMWNCYRTNATFQTARVIVDKDEDIDCVVWWNPLVPGRQNCCNYKQVGTGGVTVPSCF